MLINRAIHYYAFMRFQKTTSAYHRNTLTQSENEKHAHSKRGPCFHKMLINRTIHYYAFYAFSKNHLTVSQEHLDTE